MLLQQKYRHLVIQHIYQPAQFLFSFQVKNFSSNARHSVMSAAGASNLNDHKQFDPCFVLEVLMEWSTMFQHHEIQLPLLD